MVYVHLQFTNSTNIMFNGMSQVYNGTNTTDIPFIIKRDTETVDVTICDQNNASACQVVTSGAFVLIIMYPLNTNFSMQSLDIYMMLHGEE